jgi:hypothetical protein
MIANHRSEHESNIVPPAYSPYLASNPQNTPLKFLLNSGEIQCHLVNTEIIRQPN